MADRTKVGRYQILERAGHGGMGVVYRGYDPLLEREVAIKLMPGDFSLNEEARDRFYREAKAAARLQHCNIVTVFEFGEEDASPFIVMEFLHGSTLAGRMRPDARPPLSLPDKIRVAEQLCVGLQFAHDQGIVHRDVKPTNVWILTDGTVKLLDFGIAKVAESTLTHEGHVIGSAAYMAPEQISGKTVDGRADIFSAGVLLYELLSGRRPFEADSTTALMMKILKEDPPPIQTLVPDVGAGLAAALRRALEKDPNRRFRHARDFGASLSGGTPEVGPAPTIVRSNSNSEETVLVSDLVLRPHPRASGAPTMPASVAASSTRQSSRTTLAIAAAAIIAAAVLGVMVMSGLWKNDRGATTAEPKATATKPAQPPAPDDTKAARREPLPTATKTVNEVAQVAQPLAPQPSPPFVPPAQPAASPPKPDVEAAPGRPPNSPAAADSKRRKGLPPAPAVATITIEGEYPFEVLDGTQVISEKSETHELKVAVPRRLLLRAPEYLLAEVIRVEASGERPQTFTAPRLGKLTIRTPRETCSVTIGGHDFGFPPIVDQPLVARSYRVELKCPEGPGASALVVVPPGESLVRIIR